MNVIEKKEALTALAKLLDASPEYGRISLAVTVHGGRITRFEKAISESTLFSQGGEND